MGRKAKIYQSEILKYLAAEDKDLFLSELMEAIAQSKKLGNFDAIDECIEEWEATAELNSIPDFSTKVWNRYYRLKKAGIIND